MKRIFLFVLDSFGIGAMPDAEKFGDVGVNTLAACAASSKLYIPNMIAAGLGNIQLIKHGERLAGRASAASDFEEVEGDDEDVFGDDLPDYLK